MTERNFRKRIKDAISDPNLQTALERATSAYWKNRVEVLEGLDYDALRSDLRARKESALDQLPALFQRFKDEAERIGSNVYEVGSGDEACRLISDLAHAHGFKKIVKAKSMVSEEIELNRHLLAEGFEVTETDLGEWILQLCGERPSNLTMPAMHKTREQVAEILSKGTGEDVAADIPALVNLARRHIRQAFIDADLGISGANIAIADTGTLVIVSNEGNARLVTSLPSMHIAIVTYEKLLPSLDDAGSVLKLLSKCGTGQKMTSYVSFITGPSRTSDIEKTLTLGCYGPSEVHIIFIDNGRMQLLRDSEFREALCCIKCGACLSMCPVYRTVGGHVFGNRYFGGIGAVLESFISGTDSVADIADICTACGRCTTYCPAKIDIPRLVLALRRRIGEKNGRPILQQAVLRGLLGNPNLFESAINIARKTQSVWSPLKNLPIPWLSGLRNAPALSNIPLRERIPKTTNAERARKGIVAFYSGCVIEHVYPEIGESAVRGLSKMGWDVTLAANTGCCGYPALIKGDTETACTLAKHNLQVDDLFAADYVVTACPTCQTALKDEFAKLIGDGTPLSDKARRLSEKVYTWSEFMVNIAGVSEADFCTSNRGAITYHDPCHARHGQGIIDEPRNLLKFAGYSVVEMDQSDACCGFAGSYSLSHPDIADEISERKIANIVKTGASIVATDCPGCLIRLRAVLAANRSSIQARHTAEIVTESFCL